MPPAAPTHGLVLDVSCCERTHAHAQHLHVAAGVLPFIQIPASMACQLAACGRTPCGTPHNIIPIRASEGIWLQGRGVAYAIHPAPMQAVLPSPAAAAEAPYSVIHYTDSPAAGSANAPDNLHRLSGPNGRSYPATPLLAYMAFG